MKPPRPHPAAGAALFTLLAWLLIGAAAAPAGLVFEETTARPPARWSDTQLTATFKFRNAGAATITIGEIESSCGCTKPTLEKRAYAPGESGELRLVYSINGEIGYQRKVVTLHTTDKAQPLVVLALETNIPAPLDLQPQLVYWRTGEKPEPKIIRVTLPAELAAATLAAAPKDGTFTVELKPITPAPAAAGTGAAAATPPSAPARYELILTPSATDKITRVEIPLTLTLADGRKITRTAYAMVR